MREFHESHDGIATLATKRVADTSQFGVAITGADGRIQGFQEKPDPAEALSDLANCGIYMFRSEIFDFFPEPGTSKAAGPGDPRRLRRLGDGRLPGACSRATSPSTRTRSTPTGTTSATSRSCAQGNLDALLGAVEVEPGAPRSADGVRSASPLERGRGRRRPGADRRRGSSSADGRPDRGPGGRSATAAGSAPAPGCATSILLAGAELPAGAMLVGAIAGRVAKP